MNKRLFILLLSAALLIFSSCKTGDAEQNSESETETEQTDVYSEVLSEYGSHAISQTAVFRAEIAGAPEDTRIEYTADLTQTDTGYSVSDGGGDPVLSGGELNDDVKKAACYIPPCGEDMQGEREDGMTKFSAMLSPENYRDMLIGCSEFFDGYAALSAEQLSLSGIEYLAYSENSKLKKYSYSFDIGISAEDAEFTAHITVEITII